MSLVVSDTSALNYLILCGAVDVLPRLYESVVLPSAVAQELRHAAAPPSVRAWIDILPAWAEVRAPSAPDPATELGLGEREAIALGRELRATCVLLDDRAARRIALEPGLVVAGTVGVLELAADRNLIALAEEGQQSKDFVNITGPGRV